MKGHREGDTVQSRLMAKVAVDDNGCWIWQGAQTGTGYGHMWDGAKVRRTHRIAYEIHVGPIPEGLHLDHLCRVRLCCNPAHLEPVTIRENLLRGVGFAAVHAAQTHCIHGHEFTEANTRIDRLGRRFCRACRREWESIRRRKARNDF